MAGKRIIVVGLLLAAAASPAAPAQQVALAELRTVLRLEERRGVFALRVKDVPAQAKVKSFVLALDWWNGGVDDRVGDPAKAVREFTFEIRLGGDWIELPAATRDRRLTARIPGPEGLLDGQPVKGEWAVRQTKGEEPVRDVRVELVYLTPWSKWLSRPDLRVDAVLFDDLDRDPPAEGTFPLRKHFLRLVAGSEHAARIHLANAGYGDTKEPLIALFLTPLDGKKRTRLPPAQVGIVLREGESMRKSWTCPVPRKLAPGLYRLHATVDPRDEIKELDEGNNEFARIVEVVAPPKK